MKLADTKKRENLKKLTTTELLLKLLDVWVRRKQVI